MTTLILLFTLPAAGFGGYMIMSRIDRFIDRRVRR